MLALIALGYSLTCVLLLNLGWGKRRQNGWWWCLVVAALLLSGYGLLVSTVVAIRGLLPLAALALCLLIILGSIFKMNTRWMRICSFGILLGLSVWLAWQVVRINPQHEQWRQETPFESMEPRVPEPKPGYAEWSEESRTYFKKNVEFENHIREAQESWWNKRSGSIEAVHDKTLAAFNKAAGFGSVRMRVIHPLAEHFLPDAVQPIRQKLDHVAELVSTGLNSSDLKSDDVAFMNYESTANFSNPAGFGFVRSRTEVAGFQPHRFSKYPDAPQTWEVKRIDLVSLLLHDEPVVYVSNDLPRMADVGKLATRDLDTFEKDGLAAIRKGDDLYIRGDAEKVRVIGSMRNFHQCSKCHGGKDSDLLGAFSYVLLRK
jgi:hypothetical protein